MRARFRDPATGAALDDGLALWFPGPGSVTGEDLAELHAHGGRATVAALLQALAAQPGLRPAEPGEFTRRAFHNGKLDLSAVEGLADLIDAETDAQRRQALRVLEGAVGRRAEEWRSRMVRAAALLEATIDFADEDVPLDVTPEVLELIDGLMADLRAEIAGTAVAERLRDGFEVAIVGAPNAGKSTLLNRLAHRDVALTSDVAGTTRDVIEVRMDLRGLPVTLLDTAGLRETADAVEAAGVARARARAAAADLRVILLDAAGMPDGVQPGAEDIVVRGKADLGGEGISGLTGAGVDDLLERIATVLERRTAGVGAITRTRQRQAVEAAIRALEAARNRVREGVVELAAEDLRHAIRSMAVLVGRVDVEMVLGEIFARFCIGK
jgi:tRNA modification GTPase